MVPGNLPAQTPLVPADSFIAFDFLYRYTRELGADFGAFQAQVATGASTQAIQAAAIDNGVDVEALTDLAFTPLADSTYVVRGQLAVSSDTPGSGAKIVLQFPTDTTWGMIYLWAALTDSTELKVTRYTLTDTAFPITGMDDGIILPAGFACTFRTGPAPVGDFAVLISSEA